MRGAPPQRMLPSDGPRIIPAYAGSTSMCDLGIASRWDHPRVCGEHYIGRAHPVYLYGSSPRMRGAQLPASSSHFTIGIIPAYAGSTSARAKIVGLPEDHPRVCGEHVPHFTAEFAR